MPLPSVETLLTAVVSGGAAGQVIRVLGEGWWKHRQGKVDLAVAEIDKETKAKQTANDYVDNIMVAQDRQNKRLDERIAEMDVAVRMAHEDADRERKLRLMTEADSHRHTEELINALDLARRYDARVKELEKQLAHEILLRGAAATIRQDASIMELALIEHMDELDERPGPPNETDPDI